MGRAAALAACWLLLCAAAAGCGTGPGAACAAAQQQGQQQQQQQCAAAAEEPGGTCGPAAGVASPPSSSADAAAPWLVRFTSYQQHSDLYRTVREGVEGEGAAWSWVARPLAAAFPTDFALLAISPVHHASVARQLLGLPGVKDIWPDKRMARGLAGVPDGSAPRMPAAAAAASQHLHGGHNPHHSSHQPHPAAAPVADAAEAGGLGRYSVAKRPGRFSTPFPDMGEGLGQDERGGAGGPKRRGPAARRRLLLGARVSITSMLQANKIWDLGYSGQGIKVGVFDTGIRLGHPHLRNIRERTDWTQQQSFSDGMGHGSFVAGVIGSQDSECPGFAPDVELYTFKVFTDDQISFTSWFMDAFNYAIASKVHIINLSIGGPDFLDQPFVDKIWEVTSAGIMMVSAIGNDGPLFGTLNNPADMNDVIGVGGINNANNIAGFSSRGMTTHELPTGSGRVKPDVMAYAQEIWGSKMDKGCRSLSGTSVASPVAAGAVCLLASTVPAHRRWSVLNPASMKQALIEGADRLPRLSMYEQGAGRINLMSSMKILQDYAPRASVVPAALDLSDCPYAWPFCLQPLYHGAMPLVFNATVLNAMGVAGRFQGEPAYKATNDLGQHLQLQFEYSEVLWPWSGYLALHIHVLASGAEAKGMAKGQVEFTIVSPPRPGEDAPHTSTLVMPITAPLVPTPPRAKRVLWDTFHSIKYPPGYIPRDNLDMKHDVLDWHGDHPFTNYHHAYDALVKAGYYVEVLSSPLTCFDASQYGALLIVDPEDEFYPEEVAKLHDDVESTGLNVVVFAEWYNLATIHTLRFFDDNTRSWWTPVTGGANIPALNDLLAPFGVAFGDALLVGTLNIAGAKAQLTHGANVARLPRGAYLHEAKLSNMAVQPPEGVYGALGVAPVGDRMGHVVVYGDSNCLDSSHQASNCHDFLLRVLARVVEGAKNGIAPESTLQANAYEQPGFKPPERRLSTAEFTEYSWVLQHELRCYTNAPCQFQKGAACATSPSALEGAPSRGAGQSLFQAYPESLEGNHRHHRHHHHNRGDTAASPGPRSAPRVVPSSEGAAPEPDASHGNAGVQGGSAPRVTGPTGLAPGEYSYLLVVLVCLAGLAVVGCVWRYAKRRPRASRGLAGTV